LSWISPCSATRTASANSAAVKRGSRPKKRASLCVQYGDFSVTQASQSAENNRRDFSWILARRRDEVSNKKYGETTIGELRKIHGADFAKGSADKEKIIDVLRKLPSLRKVIREREARLFEQRYRRG
jgi:hypothetical protein